MTGRAVSWTSFAFHVRGRPSSDAIAHERCEGDLGAAGGSGAEADLAVHARRRDRGRELYPDVDFYSGILLQLMGISTNMFTVCFGIDR